MQPTDQAPSGGDCGATPWENSGLWFCPRCGALHPAPTCPTDRRTRPEAGSRLDGPVHLCACCSRVPVRSASPLSSFFCSDCGPRIVEVNRSAERLVVPVCRDRKTNCALFFPPNRAVDAGAVAGATRFIGSQIEQLAKTASNRARYLFERLRLPWHALLPLDTYLRQVAELRADVFQPTAALRELLPRFCKYVLEVPAESPALSARIEEEAQMLTRAVGTRRACSLLAQGPTAVREVALAWAWKVIDQILPIPPYLPADSVLVQERRSVTIFALQNAAVRELERVYGPATRPSAPQVGEDLQIVVPHVPGEPGPDTPPGEIPEDMRIVVGLEGPPAAPDDLLCVYHLSPDAQHERWILWAGVDEGDGVLMPAPAAWCPKDGLSPANAAFLLLEALLTQDRTAHGPASPRPRVAMRGLLDEDLADVLLDRIWKAEQP